MKKTIFLFAILQFIAQIAVSQRVDSWGGGVVNNPKNANGFVLLENDGSVKVWQVRIFQRSYSGNSYSDQLVHRETISGMNSYFIPTKYHKDELSHEYMYQIQGLNSSNQVVSDTGVQPTIGDGTAMVLKKVWVCDGYNYAYKIRYYEGNGAAHLSLDGPDYTYEFMRPEDWFCHPNSAMTVSQLSVQHNLTPVVCSWSLNQWHPAVFKLQNVDYTTEPGYYDREGYLITTDELYAVQKTNWIWPSGSIFVDNLIAANDLASADINFIIEFLNNYSNIASVDPDDPELYCQQFADNSSVEYEGESEDTVLDCILLGAQELTMNNDYLVSQSGQVLTMIEITNNCMQTGGVSYMNGLVITDVTDLRDPTTIVSLGKDDLFDLNGNFELPPIVIDKGTYCANVQFKNGKVLRFFFSSNQRTVNQVIDAMLVDVTVAPVPIVGDQFTVQVNSSTNTSALYEVLDNMGRGIYKSELKISEEDFRFPVHVVQGIPSGNVIHKFTFADGSIKAINTIK
ncbi:MAG: hypothetical protein ACK4WD_06890 [Flavobacteriales bacterium]|jgi:hypothetical protein